MSHSTAVYTDIAPANAWNELTEREGQTLALLSAGMSNKQIARDLGISDGTVKIYMRNLLRKFRLSSRLELVSHVHAGGAVSRVSEQVKMPCEGAQSRHAAPMSHVATLLDDLPGLIYRGVNDRSWAMDYVSAGCMKLTGYPAAYLTENSELTYGSLILEEYTDYIWYCVQCALLTRKPYQLDYRIRCANGSIKEVWETGVGLFSKNGTVIGLEGAIFERHS
ncbi:hypothetical protein PPUJ20066_11340 [Pseudomonas putida]|nr:hypothetical protein PPUJ20066_11340 [Pseudomonas putida]